MSDARDIVERLRANLSKYPGFVNLNEQAAAEIERLRRVEVAAREVLAASHFRTFGFPDGDISNLDFSKMTTAIASLSAALKEPANA